jgi:hypothetical protein
MFTDLTQFNVIFSGLLSIVSSLITIYLFILKKKIVRKRKLFMVAITIILITTTFCILSIPDKTEKLSTLSLIENKIKPSVIPSYKRQGNKEEQKPEKNKEIERLVDEARELDGKSTTAALKKFEQAYKLLSETQKNRTFINSIKDYTDFKTQVNHYNAFFKSLNY